MASRSRGCVADHCHHCLGYCMCLDTQTERLKEGMELALGIRLGNGNTTRARSANVIDRFSFNPSMTVVP